MLAPRSLPFPASPCAKLISAGSPDRSKGASLKHTLDQVVINETLVWFVRCDIQGILDVLQAFPSAHRIFGREGGRCGKLRSIDGY